MYTVLRYVDAKGKDVIGQWLGSLKDVTAKAKINARIARLILGNFGDCKPLKDGVWELRIDWGAGYRIYYSVIDRQVVLLLYGGDKRKQQRDIEQAIINLEDYKKRNV